MGVDFYDNDGYCGCCGFPAMEGHTWCVRCVEHVGGVGAPWDRTYFALHSRDCPYQMATKRGEPAS